MTEGAGEHTPGPWVCARTNEGEGYVLSVRHQSGGAQHAIAAVWDDNSMAVGEGIANARLIVAAPAFAEVAPDAADLLEQYAEYIRTVKADDLERHPYLPQVEDTARGLRAAIALAREQGL